MTPQIVAMIVAFIDVSQRARLREIVQALNGVKAGKLHLHADTLGRQHNTRKVETASGKGARSHEGPLSKLAERRVTMGPERMSWVPIMSCQRPEFTDDLHKRPKDPSIDV